MLRKPGKFNPEKWVEWEKQIWNYLGSLKGHGNVPLQYIIWDPQDPNQDPTDPVWNTPHNGPGYKCDAKTVFTIIMQSIIDTEAYG